MLMKGTYSHIFGLTHKIRFLQGQYLQTLYEMCDNEVHKKLFALPLFFHSWKLGIHIMDIIYLNENEIQGRLADSEPHNR